MRFQVSAGRTWALCLDFTWLGIAAGCADVRMAGFDNTTGVVRYCGNAHA